MKIHGSVAIISGGASGLGEATARRLAAGGAHVVIADRDDKRGEAIAKELGATYVKIDIVNAAEVEAAMTRASELGPLRIAVGCAGVGWAARTLSKDGTPHALDLFQTVININLVGTFNFLRLAAAAMSKTEALEDAERGVIVNTASVAAFDGQIGQAAYTASKAGVAGMTLPIARDLSAVGIRVMTIAPGTFDTPMLAQLPEAARLALAAGIPFPKRLGNPDDYAALVQHIVENRYLTAGRRVRLDRRAAHAAQISPWPLPAGQVRLARRRQLARSPRPARAAGSSADEKRAGGSSCQTGARINAWAVRQYAAHRAAVRCESAPWCRAALLHRTAAAPCTARRGARPG